MEQMGGVSFFRILILKDTIEEVIKQQRFCKLVNS